MSRGSHDLLDGIAVRLQEARDRVAAAAERVDRPHVITIVAVSKTFPLAAVEAAREAGQLDFGESRAQELRARFQATEDRAEGTTPLGARWHFVGRLQRNKVRTVVGRVTLIHSVDRRDLANAIGEEAVAMGRVQRVLAQVNVGEDPAKSGVHPDRALAFVSDIRRIPGVACQGLMTIPPLEADPRPMFARLRALRDQVREQFPEVQHLSMGMSRDYEVAVEEGATIVRLGEAVFGPREPRS